MASSELAIGTRAWLEHSGGRLRFRDRLALVGGLLGALREGIRLGRRAKRGSARNAPLAQFEPPDTPMVNAARERLIDISSTPMVNHCLRTAFWTLFVLHQDGEIAPADLETTWVAALLHDVGLEQPPPRGDFSAGGIAAVEELALAHRWPDEQVHLASEAIATNLSMRVDPARSGRIAWAMNVGGIGELGFRPHRAQMSPARVAELEARFPRTGFRAAAMQLARAEARRVPGGRFAFFRWIFPIVLR
jgi:hypothetical protein